jgi:hypothetical protein
VAKGHQTKIERVSVPVVDPKTLQIDSIEKQRQFSEAAFTVNRSIQDFKPNIVVMMCHGWATGLQLGFRSAKQRGFDKQAFNSLCVSLTAANVDHVVLFACSAGDEPGSDKTSPGTGDDSIADKIRDLADVSVLSHWTVGHTTRNPDLIFFEQGRTAGGIAFPSRGTQAYRNALSLLKTPAGLADVVLCRSVLELRELFAGTQQT